jgi:predicted nucleic-acid-binding Zn-ribbon protein
MGRKLTKEEFEEKAIKKHGNWYDYSKVVYINAKTKVLIICPIHGEFWQTPTNHLSGQGCPHCGGTIKLTKETFVQRSTEKHGDFYDYSKVEYINNRTKVLIICPIHGEFWQTPSDHLNGHGCPKCVKKCRYTTPEWVEEAIKKHGDWCDYSKVVYVNDHTKVLIICPDHGGFWQTPSDHLSGKGCPKCAKKHRYTKPEWVEEDIKKHGNWYDYSKVVYINTKTKVLIKCKRCGKEFWQTPSDHLSGKGCPYCNTSKLENSVYKILKENNINFLQQYKGFNWLKNKNPLELDFYLPEYNIGIECQGMQHFVSIEYFGGKKKLKYTQNNDILKKQLCEEHGVRLFYINYDDNVEEKLTEIFLLLENNK